MQFLKQILSILLFFVFIKNSNAQPCFCEQMLNYSATQQSNHQVKIHWETTNETDIAKDFIIQRSYDGFSTFSEIGYVSANPLATTHSYDFYDAVPCTSATDVYYRIKSTSTSNVDRYSTILRIVLSNCPSCSNATVCQCDLNNLIGGNTVCNTGDYEITNAAGPVTWTVTGSSIVSLNSLTSTRVRVTKVGDGQVTLTASISNCTSLSKSIIVGTPTPSFISMTYQSSCIGGTDWDATFAPDINSSLITYLWSINGGSYFTGSNTYSVNQTSDQSITLNIKYQTLCGTSSAMTYPTTYNSPCSSFRMLVSPNPSEENIHIKLLNSKSFGFRKNQVYQITLLNDRYIPVRNFVSFLPSFVINRGSLKPGLYFVLVKQGKESTLSKIILK